MSTDIERELKREETELARVSMSPAATNRQDKEIDRILRQCKLDHYSVLGVQPGISVADVSKLYRKKSLLIHPDKTSHPRAVEAFDLLKKASNALQDDKERKRLDQMWTDARKVLIKENGWSVDDERLTTAEFLESWRAKVRELLIEEEFIRRVELKKQQNEELKKRKEKDAELEQRKEEKRLRDTLLSTAGSSETPSSAEGLSDDEDQDGVAIDSRPLNEIPGECRMALVIRADLGMQKGKIAAQCAHAAVACYRLMSEPGSEAQNLPLLQRWNNRGQAKITLKCSGMDEMDTLFAKAMSLNVNAYIVHDAGRTQVEAGSATVLGLGPAPKPVLDLITGDLKLY
ncbi:hypothetical protein KL928_004772 [Ogataea angusta]|uniref:peptidyl-tRNA hydrolase n=1 Tax=Pichia angusta TaxID=870730 RepID=A0AAN6DC88_PICAN|nr:uncharacterized protein KL928_004772 [Ogataea angusta]KAG7816216.1 hypothetical protein KL928_004772 [Ogataea angusta]